MQHYKGDHWIGLTGVHINLYSLRHDAIQRHLARRRRPPITRNSDCEGTQDGWVTNSDALDAVQSSDHLNYDNSVVKHLH